jgi:Ca2+/Na+ antiporter
MSIRLPYPVSANLAFIALALLILFVGAETLVRGSASLAIRAGLTPLMIDLTVVAFGTSSPERVGMDSLLTSMDFPDNRS